MSCKPRSREEIVRLLAEAGLNLTAQRVAITEAVLNSRDHPNAEEIYRSVCSVLPVVSRATVYNTLKLLVKRGLLRAISVEEGAVHYDPWLEPHPHFLDTHTHRLLDIPEEEILAFEHRLEPAHFEVDDVQVLFRGRATSLAVL
jgi:Fur family peroxide stress response transcriptional regulator